MTLAIGWRIALIPATLCLAALSCLDAVVAVSRYDAPDLALRLAPHDGVALMARADALVATDPDVLRKEAARLTDTARVALRSDPLNPAALRLLAMLADVNGEQARMLALANMAERMSRREIGVQTLLIEYYVQRGDVAQALKHYDIALSTTSAGQDVLFPILVSAISEPQVQAALAPYLRRDRPWERAFLAEAIENGSDPVYLANAIVAAGELPSSPDYQVLETRLLWKLIARGRMEAARLLARRMPGFSRALFADPGFTAETVNPRFGPLAWTLTSSNDAMVEIESSGRLWLRISPDATAIAAQRTLALSEGWHVLSYTTQVPDGMQGAAVTWELRCLGDRSWRAVWSGPVPAPTKATSVQLRFNVPHDCHTQTLVLKSSGSDQQFDTGLYIENFSITALH